MYNAPPVPTWSFSKLEKADTCMRRVELEYAQKIPDPKPSEAGNRGTELHKAAENYVLHGETLHPALAYAEPWLNQLRTALSNEELVEIENEWGVDSDWNPTGYFAPNVWGRIKLDACYHLSPTEALIIDWKSGKKFGNEVKHMLQEQTYNIATFMRYPALQTITSVFCYIDKNDKTERTTTRDQALKALPALDRRARRLTAATDFPAKPNKHNCRFCPYKPSGTGHCQIGVD